MAKKSATPYRPELTHYSDVIPGNVRNHLLAVRFDKTTGGYVGISQAEDTKQWIGVDRVLLSPAQVKALLKFVTLRVPREL